MASEKAEVNILFQCLYLQFGVTKGHPVLSFRWPLTPQPEPEIGQVYDGKTFNIGSTNVVLIRDQGKNITLNGYKSQILTDRAICFLKQRDPKRPFFLLVSYTASHSPWNNHPERLVEQYRHCAFDDIRG